MFEEISRIMKAQAFTLIQELITEGAILLKVLEGFTTSMFRKLEEKKLEGYRGWNRKNWITQGGGWFPLFKKHFQVWEEQTRRARCQMTTEKMEVADQDEADTLVDIANLCMFRWWYLTGPHVVDDARLMTPAEEQELAEASEDEEEDPFNDHEEDAEAV